MKWFRMFRVIGLRRRVPPVPAVPLCPEWSDEDRAILSNFLSNPVGKRLMLRAWAVASKNSFAACKDSVTPAHSAGRAAGFSDCLNWLLSLATRVDVANAALLNSETEQAEQNLAEQL